MISHAIGTLVPQHLSEIRRRREELILLTMAAVKDRLTKEIAYWDHRANQLKDQELAGKVNAKINSAKARQRADELQSRLQKRMAEHQQHMAQHQEHMAQRPDRPQFSAIDRLERQQQRLAQRSARLNEVIAAAKPSREPTRAGELV